MASIEWSMFAVFVTLASVAGCATAPEPQAQSAQSRGVDRMQTPRPSRAPQAAPVAIGGQERSSSTEHQVAALRQAIVLYQQFIERAEHDSQYAEAVKRTRDRIEDAEATIDFLLAEPSPGP